MDAKRALRWAGRYYGLTTLAALLGLALVAAGTVLGGYEVAQAFEADALTRADLVDAAPGLALVVLGVAVYRLGKAWALYKTLTGAMEEELSDTYDTERVKSEVLSVLDERLSEMHSELSSMDRRLGEAAETGFEFGDD